MFFLVTVVIADGTMHAAMCCDFYKFSRLYILEHLKKHFHVHAKLVIRVPTE